ncbi:DUF998 domain-containing protein [Streptomyces sp. NPDC019531]|uniref:DUF998 domain-containing protein n=1 Tax=Streptomyces sp. NPDC019531 TaxID=3365062 RepID=UPI0038501DFD
MSQTNTVSAAAKAAGRGRIPATGAGRNLLVCSAIAGPFYVVVSLTQALTREGFDLTRHAWSLLSNGSLGWIQATNLMVTGLMVTAGAGGLRRVVALDRRGIRSARLWVAYGLSMVAAGIFRADPALGFPPGTPDGGVSTSWHGVLHFVSAGIGFLCLVVVCYQLARHFAAAGLRGWAMFSRITGSVFLAGFVALAGSGGAAWANLTFTAAILLAWAWLSMVSLHFRSRAPRTATA